MNDAAAKAVISSDRPASLAEEAAAWLRAFESALRDRDSGALAALFQDRRVGTAHGSDGGIHAGTAASRRAARSFNKN